MVVVTILIRFYVTILLSSWPSLTVEFSAIVLRKNQHFLELFGTSVRSCISNGYKVYIFLIENRCFSLRGTGPFSTRNRLNLVEKHVLSLNPNCKSKIKSILYILLFWLAFVVLL